MALDQEEYVRSEMAKWKEQQRRAALDPAQRAFEDKLNKWIKITLLSIGGILAFVVLVAALIPSRKEVPIQQQQWYIDSQARQAELDRQLANSNPNGPEAKAAWQKAYDDVDNHDKAREWAQRSR